MRFESWFLVIGWLTAASNIYALDASGVFRQVSPSIYVVVSKDASGQVIAQGSGVVVGRNLVVTNCHVIRDGSSVVLIQQDKQSNASVKNRDIERDLCTLSTAKDAAINPVAVSTSKQLEQGQTVYAVGAPLGLELTISDGIVSSLRKANGGFIIQTTAAISPGSSGGGLFDIDGRLIGLTTYQYVKGQNLNFAVPAEWIQQIGLRESMEEKLRARRSAYEMELQSLGDIGNDAATNSKVIRLSKDSLKNDPNYIKALYYLGFVLSKTDPVAAEPVLVKLIDQPVSSADDMTSIGLGAMFLASIYEKAGKLDLARKTASKAILYFPIELTLGNYWSYLQNSDQYREAIPFFTRATDTYPKSPYAWAYLGGSHMNVGDTASALIAFRKATELKPDYEWAWFGYMVTLRKSENKDEMARVVRYLYDNHRDMLNNILKSFGKN